MNPFQRLVELCGFRGQGGPRRVLLLEIIGLEPSAVDRYLAEGLLHNLALLSDVGERRAWLQPAAVIVEALCEVAQQRKLRLTKIDSRGKPAADLATICRQDELQQRLLIEQLDRTWAGLVICTFDLPARLRRLFGPNSDRDEQLILRDVHARMDEIVGKAYSFVDEFTVLVVVIADDAACQISCDATRKTLVFCNRSLELLDDSSFHFAVALFESRSNAAKRT